MAVCNNNVTRTREELTNYGFGSKTLSSAANGSSSSGAARATSPTRASRGASPAKQQQQQPQQQQPKSQTTTAKRTISDAEKNRITNQLKTEFPNCDLNRIGIALKTFEFDVDQARLFLKAIGKEGSERSTGRETRAAAASSTGQASTSSSSSRPAQPSQQSLLPAGLGGDSFMPVESAPSKQHRPGHTRGTSSHSQVGGAGGSGRVSSRAAASQPQQARAQQVTRPRQKLARQAAGDVVTSQPKATTVSSGPSTESGHRTATAGPNPELRRGPDRTLLLSEFIQAQGPNRELRQGPDQSRIAGPQGCCGPDVTLVSGPQDGHLSSPQRDRVVTPSAVLVSHI